MTDHPDHPDDASVDRRLALVLDRTLQGLDADELIELMAARARGLAVDPDLALEFELAAAAVELARFGTTGHPPLSPDLAERLELQADRHFAGGPDPGQALAAPPRRFARRVAPWLGWVAAAAALAVVARDRLTPLDPPTPVGPATVNLDPNPVIASPSARLVATAHPLALGAGGVVAWDQERQQGTLRVDGLAPVDPATGCYQLWIFDAARDQRYPVDGGIFTVPRSSTGQVVLVHPQVPVRTPTLFAVTLEPPGGVVVSDRARLLLSAAWTPQPSGSPVR